MASLIKSVTFDCSDALALATFWAAALGTDVAARGSCRSKRRTASSQAAPRLLASCASEVITSTP
jgi:hypothetical protein